MLQNRARKQAALSRSPRERGQGNNRAFTLLEVLVAVAILGLGLTVILSAQAGAFSSAAHARNLSIATGLVRCKMAEVEEHLYKDGFQETDESGSGACCEGDDNPNFRCTWRVDRPQFPEAHFGDLNLNAGLNLGTPGSPGASGASGAGQLGALGLLSGAGAGSTPLAGASNIGDVAKTLADANSQAAAAAAPAAPPSGNSASGMPGGSADPMAGGMGGIASMAMSFVYPSLKLLFEASTRRIVTTVIFREGSKERAIELTQWFTIPQKGVSSDEDLAPGGASSSGSPGSTSSSSGKSSSGSASSSGGRGK